MLYDYSMIYQETMCFLEDFYPLSMTFQCDFYELWVFYEFPISWLSNPLYTITQQTLHATFLFVYSGWLYIWLVQVLVLYLFLKGHKLDKNVKF